MKVGLIGYGKMGKEVESVLLSSGHEITAIYNSERLFLQDHSPNCDVFIEFSIPTAVESHIEHAKNLQKPIVIGTTGWYDKKSIIEELVGDSIGCIYSGNFSPGIQIVRKLAGDLSQKLSALGTYDISMVEKHHRHKKDSPSGTSLQLANTILENYPQKTSISTEANDAVHNEEVLHISTLRCGDIIGEHEIIADSIIDTITLSHSAKSRVGFASGAVLAAEWILNKKGFYDFSELFQ